MELCLKLLVQVSFFNLVVNFQYFNSHYPVTTLRLDLFSGAYLNKLLFLWCPETEKSLSNGSPRLGASLPENGKGVSFRKVRLL